MHCPNGRKEQISQDDDGQALLPHSLSLLPHVLQIHGYVTADITYSTSHPYHDVPTWPCATSALIPEKPWSLPYVCVTAISWAH